MKQILNNIKASTIDLCGSTNPIEVDTLCDYPESFFDMKAEHFHTDKVREKLFDWTHIYLFILLRVHHRFVQYVIRKIIAKLIVQNCLYQMLSPYLDPIGNGLMLFHVFVNELLVYMSLY